MKKVFIAIVLLLVLFSAANYLDREVQESTYSPNYSTSILLPAVDQEGEGVAASLTVETKNGENRILTNIDKLIFWIDTQESIQTAKTVAKNITNIETYNIDIIYSIDANNADVVGGPSAGAALTVATVSVLKQEPLDQSIMITGTIDKNGSIGKVGGIDQKARAAKKLGAELLLVPKSSLNETKLQAVETCEEGEVLYCETSYQEIEINYEQEADIKIKEVENIEEALKYFNL